MSINKNDFKVNIKGAPGGGWIDGTTNPAMNFSVIQVDNDTLRFRIFATSSAQIAGEMGGNSTNNFFAIRSKLVTITAANGSNIPSITDTATSSALSWPDNTFSNIVMDTGAQGYAHNLVAGNTSNAIAPSVEFTFTKGAAVRGMLSIVGTSSVDGTIPFYTTPPFAAAIQYGAPVHAHFFYTMSLADYANALVTSINNTGVETGYEAEIVGTVGTSATVKLTKTGSFLEGETLNLYILN